MRNRPTPPALAAALALALLVAALGCGPAASNQSGDATGNHSEDGSNSAADEDGQNDASAPSPTSEPDPTLICVAKLDNGDDRYLVLPDSDGDASQTGFQRSGIPRSPEQLLADLKHQTGAVGAEHIDGGLISNLQVAIMLAHDVECVHLVRLLMICADPRLGVSAARIFVGINSPDDPRFRTWATWLCTGVEDPALKGRNSLRLIVTNDSVRPDPPVGGQPREFRASGDELTEQLTTLLERAYDETVPAVQLDLRPGTTASALPSLFRAIDDANRGRDDLYAKFVSYRRMDGLTVPSAPAGQPLDVKRGRAPFAKFGVSRKGVRLSRPRMPFPEPPKIEEFSRDD